MPSKGQIWAHGTFASILVFVSLTYEQSPVYDRPVQSAVVLLASCGLGLLCLERWRPSFLGAQDGDNDSSASSASILSSLGSVLKPSQGWNIKSLRETSDPQYLALRTAFAIFLRLVIFRYALAYKQCNAFWTHAFVPLAIALQEKRSQQRHPPVEDGRHSPRIETDEWGMPLEKATPRSKGPHFFSSGCLAFAAFVLNWALPTTRSSQICPLRSYGRYLLPVLQLFTVYVEAYIVRQTELILRYRQTTVSRKDNTPISTIGSILIAASAVTTVLGGVNVLIHFQYHRWFISIDAPYIWSLGGYILLCIPLIVVSLRVLGELGALHLAWFTTFFCLLMTVAQVAQRHDPAPSVSLFAIIVFIKVFFLGAGVHVMELGPARNPRRLGMGLLTNRYVLLLATASLTCWGLWPEIYRLQWHPIDDLVIGAAQKADEWLAQAGQGSTLEAAVENYKLRYNRFPPPGFDIWHEYAIQKSSLVIDDYDDMYDELRPFWALSPAAIRQRTQGLIADPWNEVAGIEIRHGEATMGPNFKPTHRWMVEGFTSISNDFIQHLPDMDLAINMHDEPRVAVPYSKMQELLKRAQSDQKSHDPTILGWSLDRAIQWGKGESVGQRQYFTEAPRENSFWASTSACPPTSAARRYHMWRSEVLCFPCANVHSQAGIITNWTLAGSPCHQPDLRNLHGFYLSPGAYRTSHELLPIFSQSKVKGFADILIPSSWNYNDKFKYAPNDELPDVNFTEKDNTVFWRGTTSEGVSRFGTWKGMARQRLVHLANNNTSTFFSASNPILLPDPYRNGRLSPQYVSDPVDQVDTTFDISFINIDRAWDSDGADQESEFGLTHWTDFQSHWKHRYLIDTDGAGFSGRFIPFLQSRSLPFRMGLFRTWYDSRLTAWAHFVPVDIRLHGLFSTLAYFTGTNGLKGAKTLKGRVGMEKRLKAGQAIADRGREWAEKVLRKEDMEIYLFRLLLEWGRITDDERDNLGFVMGNGTSGG